MGEYEYVWYIIDSMWKRYECTIEWNENVKYGNELELMKMIWMMMK